MSRKRSRAANLLIVSFVASLWAAVFILAGETFFRMRSRWVDPYRQGQNEANTFSEVDLTPYHEKFSSNYNYWRFGSYYEAGTPVQRLDPGAPQERAGQPIQYKKNFRWDVVINGVRLTGSTNSIGLRNGEVALPKPSTVFRIACIGGSTTVTGLTNETTYPALLEKRLRRHFETDCIEVINCGISGLSSRGELARIDDFLDLDPDIVLHYNGVNDVIHYLLPFWVSGKPAWQRLLHASALANRTFDRVVLLPEDETREFFRNFTLKHYDAIIEKCRKRQIDIVFCTFAVPNRERISAGEKGFFNYILRNNWRAPSFISYDTFHALIATYNRVLKEKCRESGIKLFPIADEMVGGTGVFYDICHMTPKGIEQKSERMFSHLKKLLRQNPRFRRLQKAFAGDKRE